MTLHDDGQANRLAINAPAAPTRARRSGRAWALLLALIVGLGLPVVAATSAAAATTWTVTNVNDSGTGSLRAAIDSVNAGSGGDTIAFDIPGTGPFVISPLSDLPQLDVPVTINGYTQPGSSTATATSPAHIEIQIDGIAGGLDEGLHFLGTGAMTTVEGLSVTNFSDTGLDFEGGLTVAQGNYVGLAADGTTAEVSGAAGVDGIADLADASVIGGTTPAARNVIDSGNVTGAGIEVEAPTANIEGNWIGINATGTVGLGEGVDIVLGAGMDDRVTDNVLTSDDSSQSYGVWIEEGPVDTLVTGNLIGTNPAGTAPLGTLSIGIFDDGNSGTNIGGASPGSANVIGSSFEAVDIDGSTGDFVSGNHIGVDASGTVALPNTNGIFVEDGSIAAVEGNTIADSIDAAVAVGNSLTQVNLATVRQNSIFANNFGIDLGDDGPTPNHGTTAETGPNSLQNYPVLTAVTPGTSTTVTGTLTSIPNSTFAIDFYASTGLDGSGYAEGRTPLGSTSVTTNGAGVATFTATGLGASTAGELFTATASDDGTSEFSVSPPVAVNDTAATNENTPVTFNILANDTDADSPHGDLTINSVGPQVGGGAIVTDDGDVAFTPTTGFTGTASFSYTDIDQTGLVSNSATVTITVNAVTTAPTLPAIPNQSVAWGNQLSFTAAGSDTNTPPQTLTYSLVGAPTGVAIGASTGVVTWTPTAAQIGTATFTVKVANTSGLSATTPVAVNVTADATTTSMMSSNLDATYGQPVTFTATIASGDDGGTVAFFVDNSTPIGGCGAVGLGGPGGNQATCTTSTLAAGSHTVTARYTGDPASGASQDTLTGQTVNRAVITVTASDGAMTYGGTAPTITASYAGFVNNETSTVLTTLAMCTANATTRMTSCSGAAAANYTFTYVNGTLTVNPAVLTVTASGAAMTYGATPPTVTAAYSGFVNNETTAVLTTLATCTASASPTTNAGTYPNQTSCSGAAAANYTFTYVNGTLTVNKAPLTVTASPGTMTYGATPPTVTATYSGFVNNQTSSVLSAPATCTANASPTTNAGTYPNQTSCSGAAAANYSFTYVNGTLTVNPAVLTVTASGATMTYGATPPTVTATYSGFVNNQTSSVLTAPATCTANASPTTNAGTYPNQTSCSGAAAANYTFTYVNGILTVNKALLTVTASGATMTYGGTAPTVTATYAGFVNNQTSTVLTAPATCTANASPSPNAGTYPNRTSCSGAAAANYTFTYVNGTLTVKPAPLTIAADNQTRYFGQPNPTLTYTAHGLVNGDTAAAVLTGTPSITTTAVLASPPATYPITIAAGTLTPNSNYTIVGFTAGTLTVTKAPTGTSVTFKPSSPSFGSPVTITATVAPNPATTVASPTGTAAFYLDGAATPVATITLTGGNATLTTQALGAGPHTITAVYSGDTDFLASTSAGGAVTVSCAQTITGNHTGAVIISAGAACILNATISGSVTVQSGAALDVENSSITGALAATGPSGLRVCGTTFGGSVTVTGATGLVVIGDPGDAACAPDTTPATLTLQNNTGGVEAIGNTIHQLFATNNTGAGPYPGDVTTIAGNIIK